jgi:hypothetical protein
MDAMQNLFFPNFFEETMLPFVTALGCGSGGNLLIDWTSPGDGTVVTDVSYQVEGKHNSWKDLKHFAGSAHEVLALATLKRNLDIGIAAIVGTVQQRVDPAARKGYFVFRGRGPVLRLHTERFQVGIAEHDAVMADLDTMVQTLMVP